MQVISGEEEARLIYQGVAHTTGGDDRRLVVDIGGASTELVTGTGAQATSLFSLSMGCVTWLERYFTDRNLGQENFDEAETAAREVLRPVMDELRYHGWKVCVGASGTVQALQEIMMAQGMDERITLAKLQQLKQRLRDEPQPAVVHGQIQVRRNGSHFVLDFWTDPQGACQLTGLTRLYQNWLRFVANGCKTVTQVRGIEVVSTVVRWHPRSGEILLQHCHPTAFSADVQVFVIGNGVEFVFLVLRIRRGVRRATEGMQRKVAASGVTVRRQIDGLLQLTKRSTVPAVSHRCSERCSPRSPHIHRVSG